MTEHTKEPWCVSPWGDIQGPDSADGDDLVAIEVRGSTRQSQYSRPPHAVRIANLRRAVTCVNAMQGIPDPAAFVAAADQAAEWLRAISTWLLETDNDMKLPSGILDTDPLDIADALTAARIARGGA